MSIVSPIIILILYPIIILAEVDGRDISLKLRNNYYTKVGTFLYCFCER